MKRILWILALLPALALGQNVRFDLPITTTQAQGGNLLPVYAIPGALISFFSEPSGVLATTYNSATSTTACPTNAQVVLNGSAVCVSSADPFGNMGGWFLPGQYMATITAQGQSYNYLFSVASVTGGGSGLNQLTGDVLAGPGTGSQVATVVKVNGASVPASSTYVGTDASSHIVTAANPAPATGSTAYVQTAPAASQTIVPPANTWFNPTAENVSFNPAVLNSTSVTPSGSLAPFSIETLWPFEYVVTQGTAPSQLYTYNISTGAQVLVGSPLAFSGCAFLRGVKKTYVSNTNLLVVTCGDNGTLYTFSVNTTTGALTAIGSVSGLTNAFYPDVDGSFAYVPLFGVSSSVMGSVAKVQLSATVNPTIITTTTLLSGPGGFQNPTTIVHGGGYLYVEAGHEPPVANDSTIQVLNESTMAIVGSPFVVGHSPQKIFLQGHVLGVTLFDAQQFESIDVTNPASLVSLQVLSLGTCNPLPVVAQANNWYVGCEGNAKVLLLDESQGPSNFRIAQTFTFTAPQDMSLSGRFLLIASGTTGGVVYMADAGGIYAQRLTATNAYIKNLAVHAFDVDTASVKDNLHVGGNTFSGAFTLPGATPMTSQSSANPQIVTCPTGGTSTQYCGADGAWHTAAGAGTVTSIATTSPLAGGPITSTGTLTCPTCVISASSLTSNAVVIGGGGQASSTIGVGTTTMVLHGNASGPPSYGAVTLTTDVAGILPVAQGGTGTLSPGIVAGTNITVTGTWPNQTINSSAGGSGISGLTSGFIPLAGSSTTLTGNSHIDDGVTTAATLTASEPIAITTASGLGGGFNGTEGTAPTGATSIDDLWADSTAHRLKMNNNNGGAVVVASLSDLATTAAFGVVKCDGTTISCTSGVIAAIGGGGSAFNAITSGTNTTAAMVVGTGGSLGVSGTGTIAATTTNAIAGNVTFSTGLSTTGAGTIASPYVVTTTGAGATTLASVAAGVAPSASGTYDFNNNAVVGPSFNANGVDLTIGTTSANAIHIKANGAGTDSLTVTSGGLLEIPNLAAAPDNRAMCLGAIGGSFANSGCFAAIPTCADTSGSGTAQSCTASIAFTPGINSCIAYTTTTANTGAGLTLNVNSLGAKSVSKWMGSTTTLAANDVLAGKSTLACYDGTTWELSDIGNAPTAGGSSALSGITAATGANTIANGNNGLQIWNWAPTTNQNQFQFGETTAATNGTLGNQYILSAKTLAGSTAVPLGVICSLTGSQTLPCLHITPTWNTSGVVDAAILVNVTNTASGTASKLLDLQIGGTTEFNVDKTGKGTFAAGVAATTGTFSGAITATGATLSTSSAGATNVGLNISNTGTTVGTGGTISFQMEDAGFGLTAQASMTAIQTSNTSGSPTADIFLSTKLTGTLAEKFRFTGAGDFNLEFGHLNFAQTTAPAVTSCGGGTIGTGSTDNAFFVTGITAATSCTVTFNKALKVGACSANTSTGIATGAPPSTTVAVFAMAALTGSLTAVCF